MARVSTFNNKPLKPTKEYVLGVFYLVSFFPPSPPSTTTTTNSTSMNYKKKHVAITAKKIVSHINATLIVHSYASLLCFMFNTLDIYPLLMLFSLFPVFFFSAVTMLVYLNCETLYDRRFCSFCYHFCHGILLLHLLLL